MAKEENRTSPGTLGLEPAGILFALLLGYALSAGPVAHWGPRASRRSQSCLESLYYPLAWACEHSRIFGNVTKWYLDLWSPSNDKN